ncbi:hypothetical protein [Oceanobacillus massiliensis]|uniref:hypothetical protein n=1 Tax=Oceanobacillus massiliensis TaxID=1465765 RepID=UPI00301A1CB1
MKVATVLDYLKMDSELVEMLKHKKEHPKITSYKAFNKDTYPYIIVTLNPFNLSILTGQYRCEVRIVTDDELLVEDLTSKVNSLLHFGNKPGFKLNNQTLLHSSFAGNGFLFDEEKHLFEQVLIYTMTFKQ